MLHSGWGQKIDSIVKNRFLTFDCAKNDTFCCIKNFPAFVQFDIKRNWPSVKIEDNDKSTNANKNNYFWGTGILETGAFPKYDLFSEYCYPPPFVLKIKDSAGIMKRELPLDDYAFGKNVAVTVPVSGGPMKEITYYENSCKKFKLFADQEFSMLCDLQPYLQSLSEGRYNLTVELHLGKKDTFNIFSTVLRLKLNSPPDTLFGYNNIFSLIKYIPIDTNWYRTDIIYFNARLKFLQLEISEQLINDTKKLSQQFYSLTTPYIFLNIASKDIEFAEKSGVLEDFPEYLYPLAQCLKYELQLLKTQRANEKIKNEIFTKYPGYSWRIVDADSGNGLITKTKKFIEQELK
jgi:hypothetical protein